MEKLYNLNYHSGMPAIKNAFPEKQSIPFLHQYVKVVLN